MSSLPLPTVLRWMPRPLAPAAGALALPFFVPAMNSLAPSQIDLRGSFAQALFWITESGGKYGVPWVLAGATVTLVGLMPVKNRRRLLEAILMLLVCGGFLGAGAWMNEHVVKPAFAVPRPFLVELFEADGPAMGMSLSQFYDLPDKPARSAFLTRSMPSNLPISPAIRAHWIAETGFSFPSGHSFASTLLATFFVAVARRELIGVRLAAFAALPAWSTSVCWSRSFLRVHTPTDIAVGAVEGIVVGLIAYALLEGIRTSPVGRATLEQGSSLSPAAAVE